MLRRQILIVFFLYSTGFLLGQKDDADLNDIKAKYNDILGKKSNFETKKTEISDESTEGGQAIGYYDKKDLILIEIVWYGESGKTATEYYFSYGQLFFVLEQNFEYNRPIYWDAKTSTENGDNEVYDPKKTKIESNRYYFKDGKLILWLDNSKKKKDLTQKTNSDVGQRLTQEAHTIRDKLKN